MRSGPSHSIQARFSHAGHGAPVHITRRSEERSRARRSASGRRQMRCIMVGTNSTHSTRWLSIRARASPGSKRSITTAVPPESSVCQAVMNGPAW